MKNASIFSTALLLLATFFISQPTQAQWVNGAAIYPTDLTKKVGIGLDNPSYMLHVNGKSAIKGTSMPALTSGGGLVISNTDNGNILTLDGNKIQAATLNQIGYVNSPLLLNPFNGAVGIGTLSALKAKFVVKGDVGRTVAMFGQGEAGISLVRDWPTVGFNAYYSSGTWKAMSTGFGALLACNPANGRIELIQNGNANVDQPVSQTKPLIIEPNGNVGVGTDNPAEAKLVVKGDKDLTVAMFGQGQAGISLVRNWPMLAFNAYHSSGVFKAMSTGYSALMGCDPTSGRIVFIQNGHANSNATVSSQSYNMSIEANGNVAIGGIANGYRLSVAGKVICEELKVQLRGSWPDYVFADGYKLKPLEEVEEYIGSENHLPGIPAAAEMENEGIAVGEMQKKMMEKIEELTLYVIAMNKENKRLKHRVEQLENNR